MISGIRNVHVSDRFNQHPLIGLYFLKLSPLPMWKIFENIPVLPIQRHMRAKWEIIIWSGDDIYNVTPVTNPTLTFLHYTVVDICVTVTVWAFASRHGYCRYFGDFCNSANSEHTSCIDFYIKKNSEFPPVHIANRVTVKGNHGATLYHLLSAFSYELSPL